jgi:hypothetical protein
MGGLVSDSATRDVIAQINARFEAGEAIEEMAALQKEFKIFSPKHSLYDSWLVLNIKASDPNERTRWRNWAEKYMKRSVPSDLKGVNGHDRLVRAYQENLESRRPLPMHYTHHLAKDDPRVLISRGKGPLHSVDDHIIMSIPIKPVASKKRRA